MGSKELSKLSGEGQVEQQKEEVHSMLEEGSQLSVLTSQEDMPDPGQCLMGEHTDGEIQISPEREIPEGKILVHNLEGTFFMEADKWPKLIEPTPAMTEGTSEGAGRQLTMSGITDQHQAETNEAEGEDEQA